MTNLLIKFCVSWKILIFLKVKSKFEHVAVAWHSLGADAQVRGVIRGIYLATEKQSCHANLISFYRRVMNVTSKAKFTARLNSDY